MSIPVDDERYEGVVNAGRVEERGAFGGCPVRPDLRAPLPQPAKMGAKGGLRLIDAPTENPIARPSGRQFDQPFLAATALTEA